MPAPLSEEDLQETIREIKKNMRKNIPLSAYNRILVTDLPAAVEFMKSEFKTYVFQMKGDPFKVKVITRVGQISPPAFAEAVLPLLGDTSRKVRSATAVALEQLANPKTVPALFSRLRKENEPMVKKNLLRALGPAGKEDKKVIRILAKYAQDSEELLRINSMIALASVPQSEEIQGILLESLQGVAPREKIAAACAMGLSGQKAYIELLEQALAGEDNAVVKDAVTNALLVLRSGKRRLLQVLVSDVAKDKIKRARYFGIKGLRRGN